MKGCTCVCLTLEQEMEEEVTCLDVWIWNCPCHSRILFSILLHQEGFLCPWTLSPCTSQEHPVSPGSSLLGRGGLVGIIHLHCSPEQNKLFSDSICHIMYEPDDLDEVDEIDE